MNAEHVKGLITPDKRALGIATLFFISILGLFVVAHAAPFDYAHYQAVLNEHARPGVSIDGIVATAVDYAALSTESKKQGSAYSNLLKAMSLFDPETLGTREDKIAFWINLYNVAAIKTIIDHYPVDSIRSRKISWSGLPWNRNVISVGGKDYSLSQVENNILLDAFKDLRIHFGINCASVSCVNLAVAPYQGATLPGQLEEQGRRFLADEKKGLRLDRSKKIIYLSQVFKFDRKHFDQLGGGALSFILPYVRPEDREFVSKEQLIIEYLDYNWKSNDIRNAN